MQMLIIFILFIILWSVNYIVGIKIPNGPILSGLIIFRINPEAWNTTIILHSEASTGKVQHSLSCTKLPWLVMTLKF